MAKLSCFSIIPCIPQAPDGVNGSTAISLSETEAFNLYYKLKSWKINTAYYTADFAFDSPYGRSSYSISCNPVVNEIYDRSNGGLIDEKSLACNLPLGEILLNDDATGYQMVIGLGPNWYKKENKYIYIPSTGISFQVSPDNFPRVYFSISTFFDGADLNPEHYIAAQFEEEIWINYANFSKQIGFVSVLNKVIPLFATFYISFEFNSPYGGLTNAVFESVGSVVIENLTQWEYQS